MKILLLVLLLLAPALRADEVLVATDWIDSDEMSQLLAKMNKNNLFPCLVVGGIETQQIMYKASYCAFLPDMRYFNSRWGMTDTEHQRYNEFYLAKKMQPYFHTTFTDDNGNSRHQVTWILRKE